MEAYKGGEQVDSVNCEMKYLETVIEAGISSSASPITSGLSRLYPFRQELKKGTTIFARVTW